MGVLFQFNLPSLFGGYGYEVRRKAEWLLKDGHYRLAGFDIHQFRVWTELLTRKTDRKLLRLGGGITSHIQ